MRAGCKVLVSDEIAESLPSRPDRVQECLREAEESMAALAKERNRHLAERPQLVDTRPTGLGLVELSFEADTESD